MLCGWDSRFTQYIGHGYVYFHSIRGRDTGSHVAVGIGERVLHGYPGVYYRSPENGGKKEDGTGLEGACTQCGFKIGIEKIGPTFDPGIIGRIPHEIRQKKPPRGEDNLDFFFFALFAISK